MFGRARSYKLVDLFGIRVGVDASWFVVLFVVIYLLSGSFQDVLDSSDGVAYATAVASALLFFASIVVHELGHALAARSRGIETSRIDLWFFGGLARLSRDSRTPGEEFWIAIAGPLMTLVVVIVCFVAGAAVAGTSDLLRAADLSGNHVSPALLLLSWVGTMNVVLLIFNLVPAFPLDGGRIARAAVWKLTGDRTRATRASARLGQLFAYGLIAIGIALLVSGAFSGLYLIVLGFLFGSSARAAIVQSAVAERLEGVRVADVMDPDPVCVPADLPLDRAQSEYFDRYGWSWFPVVDTDGRLAGLLRAEAAQNGSTATSGTAMEPPGPWRVRDDGSLEELLASEPLRRLGGLVAVDADGRPRGVVTLGRVRRALAAAVGPRA
jgi:Zn-dependent protease